MLLAVAEGVMHGGIDKICRATVISQVLLVLGDTNVGLRLAVVEIVVVGIVSVNAVVLQNVVAI